MGGTAQLARGKVSFNPVVIQRRPDQGLRACLGSAHAQGASGEDLALNAAVAHLRNVVHPRAPPLAAADTRGWDHLLIYRLHSVRSSQTLIGAARPPTWACFGAGNPWAASCQYGRAVLRLACPVRACAAGPGRARVAVTESTLGAGCAGVCGAAAAVHAVLGRRGHGRGSVHAHPGPRARPCEANPSLLLRLPPASPTLSACCPHHALWSCSTAQLCVSTIGLTARHVRHP